MTDVREMFLELGTPRYLADMAIPMTWLLPGTTDPDEPATIEIINSVQRGLRKLGYKEVAVSGVVDIPTGRALDQISGTGWVQRTWIQIMSDVIGALRNPREKVTEMRIQRGSKGMGNYFQYDGYPPGPLPGILVGLPPGPLGDTSTNQGTVLTYGKGIKDPNNMVPVDAETKAAFKRMQRQLNRMLSLVNKRVSEDGIIGTSTRNAALALKGKLKVNSLAITALLINTAIMAAKALTLSDLLEMEADAAGVPQTANAGVSAVASADTTKRPMTSSESATAMSGGMMGQIKKFAPWIALAGGVAWYVSKQRKGKGKSK